MDCCFPFSNDVIATSAKIEVTNAGQLRNNAVAVPTDRSSAGVEENGKSHTHVAEDIEPAWSTSSSHSMLNRNFSNFFLKYLQTDREADRPPPEGDQNLPHSAGRSLCVIDAFRFLEESNAHISWKASQALADTNASYKSEIATLKQDHEQRVLELSSSLKSVSKAFSDAPTEVTRLKLNLTAIELELQNSRKAVEKMQVLLEETRNNLVSKGPEAKIEKLSRALKNASEELSGAWLDLSIERIRSIGVELKLQDGDKAARIIMQAQHSALIKNLERRLEDLSAKKEGLEDELSCSQVAAWDAQDLEALRLTNVIQEMDRTTAKMLQVSLGGTLNRELALFEQMLRQNSSKNGSTANTYDNLALLKSACESVDRATVRLSKYLNRYTCVSDLEFPIRYTRTIDFSKPDPAVKHAWGSNWICEQMFQGFEHDFFDTGLEHSTSPLDFQKHRLQCFQIFQKTKRVPSLLYFKECDLFRRFCFRKLSLMFQSNLIVDAHTWQLKRLILSVDGGEESELDLNFLDLAKAIYLLHKLSFSFDPPARILRMGDAWGTI